MWVTINTHNLQSTICYIIIYCLSVNPGWSCSISCRKALSKPCWCHTVSSPLKTERTTTIFCSFCFTLQTPQQARRGCPLPTCEIPARWIFLSSHRHLSRAPSFGALERSHRPTASVKTVSYAALWVSDPNPPYSSTTVALLSHVPACRHPPPLFFLSALHQSEPKSLYICSTWLLPSMWPTSVWDPCWGHYCIYQW